MNLLQKITSGFLAALALMALVVTIGVYSLDMVMNAYRESVTRSDWLVHNGMRLEASIERLAANYHALLAFPREEQEFLQGLRKNQEELTTLLSEFRQQVTSEEGRRLVAEVAVLLERFETAQERVVELVHSGRREEAMEQSRREVRTLLRQLSDRVNQVLTHESRLATEAQATMVARAKTLKTLYLIMATIGILGGLGATFSFSRSFSRHLRQEIMQLASATAEITAMTKQVAVGSASTASAVNETTVTAEEVKQTAQMSLQQAKYTAETAKKAAQAAEAGKRAVEDAIASARRIQEQMGLVAEGMVRLAEQTQAAGEIIATVNDLADQSNLLAVNAAIEAAKAGEQGKGFAVVAQEVRNLAERSKEATSQVRAILNDIQKAVSAAVMATEQGSKAVEAGLKPISDAGETIQLLAATIAEGAKAAAQITASSQEQLAGVEQVALAMRNIHEAISQNAEATKQANEAAQQLKELGLRLRDLVEGKRKAAPTAEWPAEAAAS
ncbi:MAG: HAMP domain-containing methyl-accepting chemotaxis protein [Acidobacteriota bacterium]